VALAWLRQRAETLGIASVPIPGTRRAARVDENAASLTVELTGDQLATLEAGGRRGRRRPVRRPELGVGRRE